MFHCGGNREIPAAVFYTENETRASSNSIRVIYLPGETKGLDSVMYGWHTLSCRREHPRRYSWKTPPGPRGSNGIQTMLVGVLFPAVFFLFPLPQPRPRRDISFPNGNEMKKIITEIEFLFPSGNKRFEIRSGCDILFPNGNGI